LLWARSIDFETMPDSIGCSSVKPKRSITLVKRSPPKRRITSSSSEMKKRDEPGSP
jgi:hypothetical protein